MTTIITLAHSASVSLAVWFGLTFLLNLVLGKKSQIDAWCETRPRISGLLKLTRGLGLDPWLALQGLSLVVAKKLPTAYAALAERLARVLAGAAVALLLAGCAGSFEEARLAGIQSHHATASQGTTGAAATTAATRDDATCQAIDRRHQLWGGVEYGGLALTGVSGIGTIPTTSDSGRVTLAIGTVLFATATAVAKYEDGLATDAWAQQCSTSTSTTSTEEK